MSSSSPESIEERLEGLSGAAMIETALEACEDRLALVSSFGTESAVLLHMTAEVDANIPIIFLDTGKLFAPTYGYQRRLTEHLGLRNVRTIRPEAKAVDDEDPMSNLWRDDPDRCCAVRKVWPLARALQGFDAWITGRKKFQTTDRGRAKHTEIQDGRVVMSPLLQWEKSDLDAYFITHGLLRHPLEDMGYPSVGCFTCTAEVHEGDGQRSGRWQGQAKTECGIHRPSLRPAA